MMPLAPSPSPLLQVTGLVIETTTKTGTRRLVDDLTLTLKRGETLALVGESGAGKSLTAKALVGLLPPSCHIHKGHIRFADQELVGAPTTTWQHLRGRHLAMVFQEPGTAFDPVMRLGAQLTFPMMLHRNLAPEAARRQTIVRLEQLGLDHAEALLELYPHELSGGMRQRMLLAMALAADPELLIADEPTSAMDTTTVSQLLATLQVAQRERQLALLLITHDVVLASSYADRIAVMRAGQLVETLSRAQFCGQAQHPYSRELWELATTAQRNPPGDTR